MAVSVLVVFSGAGPWIGREILAGFQQQFNTTRQALPTLLGTHWWQRARPAATIDRINISEASRLAMKMAIGQLQPAADFALVDAVPLDLSVPQEPLIQGDERCHAIAAASIPAKVYRDRMMCEWDRFYPEYGLANHKGYHAPEHMAAIRRLGPTPLHRFSFAPVRQYAFHSPLARQEQMEMFAAV